MKGTIGSESTITYCLQRIHHENHVADGNFASPENPPYPEYCILLHCLALTYHSLDIDSALVATPYKPRIASKWNTGAAAFCTADSKSEQAFGGSTMNSQFPPVVLVLTMVMLHCSNYTLPTTVVGCYFLSVTCHFGGAACCQQIFSHCLKQILPV